MAALLSAKDLCKTYVIDKRQNNVLKNINLEVNEGEMIAIMGPSGSGKSTLLYAISGMDRVTSGQLQRACICRSRVLFIVDGNIKGEYTELSNEADPNRRERGLNNWLLDQGW